MHLATSPTLLLLISGLFFTFGIGVHPWLRAGGGPGARAAG